jgi:hypothetical protein
MGLTMSSNHPTLSLDIDGTTFAVAFDRYDGNRCRYWWRIAVESHNVADENTDLTAPGEPDLPDALRTLLTFANGAPDLFPNLHAAGADLEEITSAGLDWLTSGGDR